MVGFDEVLDEGDGAGEQCQGLGGRAGCWRMRARLFRVVANWG